VIERFAAFARRLDEDAELLADLFLADVLATPRGRSARSKTSSLRARGFARDRA
jgi:hypothetical protein